MDQKLYPENFLSITLLLISLILAVSIFFFKLKKRGLSFELGILFALLFFLTVPSLFLIFGGLVEVDAIGFAGSEIKDIALSNSAIEIFILSIYILLISLWTLFTKETKKVNREVNKRSLLFVILMTFFISVFIGSLTYYFSGVSSGGSDWYSGVDNFTSSLGTFGVLLSFLHMSARLIFISYFFHYYKTHYSSSIIGPLALISFGIFDSLLTGNRLFLFIILALIFVEYFSSFKPKKILNLILISPFLIILGFLASTYTHFRYYISNAGVSAFTDLSVISEIISNFDFAVWGLKSAILGMFESINFNVLMNIFSTVDYQNMFWGESYLKFLFTVIPRSIWPDKPESIAYQATEILSPSTEGLSIALTFIGEMHFNFWYLGFILILPFLSFIRFLLQILYKDDSSILKYLSFSFGVLLFRMSFSDVLVIMLIAISLIYLCKLRVKVIN